MEKLSKESPFLRGNVGLKRLLVGSFSSSTKVMAVGDGEGEGLANKHAIESLDLNARSIPADFKRLGKLIINWKRADED